MMHVLEQKVMRIRAEIEKAKAEGQLSAPRSSQLHAELLASMKDFYHSHSEPALGMAFRRRLPSLTSAPQWTRKRRFV